MNEAEIKRQLVKQAREEGAYAARLEHQYLVGIPDLIFKLPETDWIWIEVKWFPKETTKVTYPNKTSEPQRTQLKAIEAVNGKSFILSVFKYGTSYMLRFSRNFDADHLAKSRLWQFEKKRGKKWPVRDFLLALNEV